MSSPQTVNANAPQIVNGPGPTDHLGLGIQNSKYSTMTNTTHHSSDQPAVDTNVDLGDLSKNDGSVDTSPVAHTAFSAATTPPPAAHLQQITFVLDSGAACHMSPERSDFKTFQPTPPRAVGTPLSRTYAIGVGTVEFLIAGGHKITLDNVLFVPSLSARILSVPTFTLSGDYVGSFGSHCCWIAKTDGTTILRSNMAEHKGIPKFEVVAFTPRVAHWRAQPATALFTSRT